MCLVGVSNLKRNALVTLVDKAMPHANNTMLIIRVFAVQVNQNLDLRLGLLIKCPLAFNNLEGHLLVAHTIQRTHDLQSAQSLMLISNLSWARGSLLLLCARAWPPGQMNPCQ